MFMSSAKLSSNSDKLTFRNKTFENSRSAILANFGWTSARRAIFPEVLNNNERRFTFEYLFDVVVFSSSSTPSQHGI